MIMKMRREVYLSVKLQNGEECLLGHLYPTDLLHALLALLLLLEELALTADIAAVALRSHILADGLNSLPRDDFRAYSSLYGDVKLLPRDELLEFLTHAAPELHRVVGMSKSGKGIDTLPIKQDVELYEV